MDYERLVGGLMLKQSSTSISHVSCAMCVMCPLSLTVYAVSFDIVDSISAAIDSSTSLSLSLYMPGWAFPEMKGL